MGRSAVSNLSLSSTCDGSENPRLTVPTTGENESTTDDVKGQEDLVRPTTDPFEPKDAVREHENEGLRECAKDKSAPAPLTVKDDVRTYDDTHLEVELAA